MFERGNDRPGAGRPRTRWAAPSRSATERGDDRPGAGRLRTALAIVAVTAVVASMAIVGTVAAQPGQRFLDVPRTHYAYESIEWAVVNGITLGCGDGRNFCPDQSLNRAHMVTFLKRYHDKFGSGSGAPAAGDDNGDPEEYTLSDFGATDESISLRAGRYRVTFTLEHDDTLDEFSSISLTVEDSSGRRIALCLQATTATEGYDTENTYVCRENIDVGDRLGELDPGRIYFEVGILDNPEKAGSRVHFAEWEIVIAER